MYSDDATEQSNFNQKYENGKLCAYSLGYTNNCPVGLSFQGISESFGMGITTETSIIQFGDDFNSDCTIRNIC